MLGFLDLHFVEKCRFIDKSCTCLEISVEGDLLQSAVELNTVYWNAHHIHTVDMSQSYELWLKQNEKKTQSLNKDRESRLEIRSQ